MPDLLPGSKFPGPPPWHWGCRTVLVPVTKSWSDLAGIEGIPEPPESTRASMDGKVSDKLSYKEWLKKKPVSSQQKVLGKGKQKLWSEGKINFADLVDQTGRPLSLDQLQHKLEGVKRPPKKLKVEADPEPAQFNPKGTSTFEQFRNESGVWTAERRELHQKIVDEVLSAGKSSDDPIFYMMGGGPASGKSVALKSMKLRDNVVVIDPDDIKKRLPEFSKLVKAGDSNAANFVHEESSYLSKRIMAESFERGYNTLLDGTGDSKLAKLTSKVNEARARGMKVKAIYVTADTDTAWARSVSRAAETGRFVPEAYLRETHRKISEVLPQALKQGLFDEFDLFDTNGPKPKLVATVRAGKFNVLDNNAWRRFLDKAELKPLPAVKPKPRFLPNSEPRATFVRRATNDQVETTRLRDEYEFLHEGDRPSTYRERQALDVYTQDGYDDINNYLRGREEDIRLMSLFDNLDEIDDTADKLSSLIAKQPPLKKDIVVYRFRQTLREHVVGSEMSWDGFTSTSLYPDEHFLTIAQDKGAAYEIFIAKGTTGIQSGHNFVETELLLNHRSRFRVIEKVDVQYKKLSGETVTIPTYRLEYLGVD